MKKNLQIPQNTRSKITTLDAETKSDAEASWVARNSNLLLVNVKGGSKVEKNAEKIIIDIEKEKDDRNSKIQQNPIRKKNTTLDAKSKSDAEASRVARNSDPILVNVKGGSKVEKTLLTTFGWVGKEKKLHTKLFQKKIMIHPLRLLLMPKLTMLIRLVT
jgi:hypothetical protein